LIIIDTPALARVVVAPKARRWSFESRGVLRDTGPVARFAAREQQPATLNEVIEATTSELGTHGAMSEFELAFGVRPDLTIATADFRV
jgi:hypothetical protein